MFPIEETFYNAWAGRLEDALQAAHSRTLWLVLRHDELEHVHLLHRDPLWDDDRIPVFRLVAVKMGTQERICEDVPFTLVVDEDAFPLVVELGRKLEQQLAATVGEG